MRPLMYACRGKSCARRHSGTLARNALSTIQDGDYPRTEDACTLAEVHPGLSFAAFTVLTQSRPPGTLARDLADLFGLDKSTISRQINELEAAGLIGREGERPGRRGYTLLLTAEGQRKLEQEAERARQRLATVLASWKERDITAFAGMIERFLTDLG